MTQEPRVACRQVEITNPLGLHLRPADKFVKVATSFGETEVRVRYQGKEFNGKSILELAMLAAECGTVLELEARGDQAENAVEALVELVLAKFHENADGSDAEAPAP